MELKVEITVGDYKTIASQAKRRKIEVQDKEVEDSLAFLQKSRAKFSQVQRPAQKGDFVEIEYKYKNRSEKFSRSIKDKFILGQGRLMDGFERNLQGLKGGASKEFFLKDKENKKINFKVKLLSVQNMELPQLNDDFARGLGGFKNLQELQASIKQGIFREKEIAESSRLRQEILEKAVSASDFNIPNSLIEAQRQRLLENLKQKVKQQLKVDFLTYLKTVNKTEEQVLEELLPVAEQGIKSSLLLEEISKRENISVSKQEVEQRVNNFLKQFSDTQRAEKDIDLEGLKRYIREVIRNEKTLATLEGHANNSL